MSGPTGAVEQPSGVQHATDTFVEIQQEATVEIQDIHVTDTYSTPLVLEPVQDNTFWALASALAWPAATGVASAPQLEAVAPQLEAVAPHVSPAIELELPSHPGLAGGAWSRGWSWDSWSGGWSWDSWSSGSWSDWSGWSGQSSGWDQSDWSGIQRRSEASRGDRQACRQS